MTTPLDFQTGVPVGWRSVRLKDIATYVNRGLAPEYADAETGLLAFNQKCVRPDLTIAPELGRPIVDGSYDDDSPSVLRAGDIVINSTGRGTLGRAALVQSDPELPVVADGHVTIVRTNPDLADARFVAYLLGTRAFYEQANVCLAVGATNQTELNRESVRRMAVVIPPVVEQRSIARRLDEEIARVDGTIQELSRLRTLVHEDAVARQTALVLRGWHSAPCRASGHEWMGSIPAHWRVSRLKFEARLESGHTPARSRPELWIDCTIPWVSLNDVGTLATVEFLYETTNLISEEGIAASSARVLPAGTVVVSRDATIGRCGILGVPMATSQHFANWICSASLEPRYLWLVFRTAMQSYFDSLTDGATLRTIGMPDMKNLVVPVPPLAEQRLIVERAALVREREAALVDEIEMQIALLQEHRQAFITAGVSGRLDALEQVA